MSVSNRFGLIGAVFLVFYGGVLLWHGPTRSPEAFPFFSWSLFSDVPAAQQTDYSIRFTSVDGVELDQPLFLEESKEFLPTANAPQAYQVAQQLGRAVDRDQILRSASSKELLDSQWLDSLREADYEIVRRRFDILERYRCDCYLEVTVLQQASLGS